MPAELARKWWMALVLGAVVLSTGCARQDDAFEYLLLLVGLDNVNDEPPRGAPLTPQEAARVLTVLLNKPVTLGSFPPRMAVCHLLCEVLDEALNEAFKRTGVSREEFSVTKWGKDKLGKSAPVEWRAPDGAGVNIDRGSGGAARGHIFLTTFLSIGSRHGTYR